MSSFYTGEYTKSGKRSREAATVKKNHIKLEYLLQPKRT